MSTERAMMVLIPTNLLCLLCLLSSCSPHTSSVCTLQNSLHQSSFPDNMTFASSADPLPASWYRLPQDTYTLKARSKAALVNPLVVTFTASGWPRNGGVPFNMATRVENGNDLPLKGIKETLTITLRFLVCVPTTCTNIDTC